MLPGQAGVHPHHLGGDDLQQRGLETGQHLSGQPPRYGIGLEQQVHVLQAKGEADAMQYTLPLKQKQIEQSRLEAQARKEATIQNAEAEAQAKVIDSKAESERRKVLADAEADRIRVTAVADADRAYCRRCMCYSYSLSQHSFITLGGKQNFQRKRQKVIAQLDETVNAK